jgi:hypothetical protein
VGRAKTKLKTDAEGRLVPRFFSTFDQPAAAAAALLFSAFLK